MSKKVTLSVPDELYEKMKAWKSSMNFSQVFQSAISGMLRKKEELASKIKEEMDLSAIIERLKKEKIEHEFNLLELGKQDGLEWSKTAHYRELQFALAWDPNKTPQPDDVLKDYFAQMFESYRQRIAVSGRMAQDLWHCFSEKYIRGWKEGVELFWNEVKDKL